MALKEFRDFRIEFSGEGDDLQITVESEASGESSAKVPNSRRTQLLQYTHSSISGRGSTGERRMSKQESTEAPSTSIGQDLFNILFSETGLSRALETCMTDAERDCAGVRLRFTFNLQQSMARDLAQLPWEMLHDPIRYRDFGLRPDTPIVRYVKVPQRVKTLDVQLPLRILVVSSNPRGDLDLEQERKNLAEALQDNAQIKLDFIEGATLQKIAHKVRDSDQDGAGYHVLHYMGHGDFIDGQGVLLLHGEQGGKEDPVKASDFNFSLQSSKTIRVVFLNACNTAQGDSRPDADPFAGTATALVSEGVPAVVAMQRPIEDRAAIVFAQSFYSRIAQGWPVDAAVSEARREVYLSRREGKDWAIPVLFMRSENGILFQVKNAEAAAASPTPGAVRPANDEEEEDSDGELVPMLCNRQAQEQQLLEKFLVASPGVPQIYFLPGREDAMHSSFINRVQYRLVPRMLGEEFESLRNVTQFFAAEWIQKPPTGKELPYLTMKLAWQIDSKLRPDAALIRKHPRIAGNIVIIQHRLYAKYWNEKMPGLLQDYIGFWEKAASEQEQRPLILIFFNVIFDDAIPANAKQIVALKDLAEQCDGKPCSVTLFDQLEDVGWDYVADWLEEFLRSRRKEAGLLKEKLFKDADARPMKEVEAVLREFVG